MNKLINIENHDGQPVVTSRQVAGDFNKRHDNVIAKIETAISNWNQNTDLEIKVSNYFIESTYKDESGKSNKEYLLTRDGFSYIVMGFTGKESDEWKLKYIEAFNKMEKSMREMPMLSKELQAIIMLDQKTQHVENRLDDLEYGMPLYYIDCKELQAVVRKIGIKVLGGYKSPAYNDNSLRGKVYADIQNQIKRQFGVGRYEAIKRGQREAAMQIVTEYKVPLVLEDQIRLINNQLRLVGKGVM